MSDDKKLRKLQEQIDDLREDQRHLKKRKKPGFLSRFLGELGRSSPTSGPFYDKDGYRID